MSPPQLIPFREIARDHVTAAKALLGGQGPGLRYACLELRLALEALTYDILQTYQDDLDDAVDEALTEWHPAAILEGLRAYDPIGDATLVANMTIMVPGGEAQMIEMREKRFSAEWAAEAHRALSSFLHQLTVGKLRKGKRLDETKLRAKSAEIIEKLEAVLDCPVSAMRLGFRFGYPCPGCGEGISVAMIVLIVTGMARTTCAACRTNWQAQSGGPSGQPLFTRLPRGRRRRAAQQSKAETRA